MSARSTTSVRRRRSGSVASWPPRWLTAVPVGDRRRGDGGAFEEFAESYCRVTKDSVAAAAGELLSLRPWQRQLFGHLLARRPDRRYRHRQALIGVARKNGKSALGSALGLGGLLLGPAGGEVYSCAADKEQARIVFGTARRMVELDSELSSILKLYRDVIEYRETGAIYRVLSAEAYTKEGLNPHLVLFDEVHAQPNRELWDVMALAMGARLEPLLVGITTAGVKADSTGQDSLCYGMYQYGKRVAAGELEDPSFFMAWWEPRNPEADHRLESTQREANPGFDDLVSAEDFRSAVLRTPEAEYRTKRCNQWVSTAQAWLPSGAWDSCTEERSVPDGVDVVLGFDGSYNNDSTALVVVELGDKPHIDVVECWERPVTADDSWKVPIFAVEDAIRQACRRWSVREVACDPARWARSMQLLEDEGLPIVEYPQSAERMVPATQRLYEAVLNHTITHSGDPRLARHIANCVLRINQRGAQLAKETKTSSRKIDLAVATVVGLDRASQRQEAEAVPMVAWR